MSQFKSTLRAIVIAVLVTVLVEIVRRTVLMPMLGFSPKIMPSLLTVMLAAWFGGENRLDGHRYQCPEAVGLPRRRNLL